MAEDETWRNCEGSWERLRWARTRRFSTAKDAATLVGMKEGTYRAYERRPNSSKHTPLEYQTAVHFARKFGVRWEWLLLGDGAPKEADTRRERILLAYDNAPEDRKEAVADAIERLLRAG